MKKFLYIFAMTLLLIINYAYCDELYHNNGKVITGQIINETEDKVTIYTDRYGKLTYEKVDLVKIVKSAGAENASAATSTSTQSQDQTANQQKPADQQNPFSTSGQPNQADASNPFSGQAPQNPTTGNADNPFQSSGNSQFAGMTNPMTDSGTGQQNAAVATPQAADAIIENFSGEVTVKKMFNWEPASINMPIKSGMEVKVAGQGFAKVKFPKDRNIFITDNSEMKFSSITNGGDLIAVKLLAGSGWFNCPDKAGLIGFTLSTPNLILNTNENFHFKLALRADNKADLDINIGSLQVTVIRSSSRQFVIHKGQSVTITADGETNTPQHISDLKIQEYDEMNTKPVNASLPVYSPPEPAAKTQMTGIFQNQVQSQVQETQNLMQQQMALQGGQPQQASQQDQSPFAQQAQPQASDQNPFAQQPQQEAQPQSQTQPGEQNPFAQQPQTQPAEQPQQVQQPAQNPFAATEQQQQPAPAQNPFAQQQQQNTQEQTQTQQNQQQPPNPFQQ